MDSVPMGRLGQVKIVANGCSFTHEGHFQENERWTFKLQIENLALGGSSNEHIFHTTLEYLNKNTPDVLIIGWTDYDRYSITHNSDQKIHITPNQVLTDSNQYIDQSIIDYYYKNFHSKFLNLKNFFTYYSHIEKYCIAKNIKFINFCAISSFNQIVKEFNGEQREYLDKEIFNLKPCNWIEQKVGYSYWFDLVIKNNLPLWHDGHPGLEASHKWQEIVRQNLY
jgi:hypothetical protein